MRSGESTIGALQVQQAASEFQNSGGSLLHGHGYPIPTNTTTHYCTLLRREVVNLRFSSWTTSRTNPERTGARGYAYALPIVDDSCSVDVSVRFPAG